MRNRVLLILMIVFFCIAWSNNPKKNTPVCTADSNQTRYRVIPDGYGGTIMVWEDWSNSSYSIYAQRLDCYGEPQWQLNGEGISSAGSNQEHPELISDGAGGAIITWEDDLPASNYYDIYIQRLNPFGKKLWTNKGVKVISSDWTYPYPRLVSDGKSGAIITWRGAGGYIYAQRFNSTGKALWGPDGVRVCTAEFGRGTPKIAADGSGGAVIAWSYVTYDYNSISDLGVYIQRIDSAGTVLWGNEGVNVIKNDSGTYFDAYLFPELVPDGSGGVFITYFKWDDDANAFFDPYTQRIDGQGTLCWKKPGVKTITADWYNYPKMVTDGSGGVIIVWSYKGVVFAQRLNSSGKIQWQKNGAAVTTGINDFGYIDAVPDNSGGAILAMQNYWDSPIFSQRINSSGEVQWDTEGVAISTTDSYKWETLMAADGFGGAVFVWSAWDGDYTHNYYQKDIYAQNICANGEIGDCSEPISAIDTDRFGAIDQIRRRI